MAELTERTEKNIDATLGLKCLSLAFHWTWPYNPKQGTQYTSIYTGERERDIYANILHNVQAICKANSISFFALSQSTPPQSQVMCKRKVKCKADDGQTDWQIDKSSQLTETCPAPPRNDLTPNQFVVWLASLWQSDDAPFPLPCLCQCKQMHWELFATCSNIIKFQNRLTARGANCSFYFKQQQQRLALSLSLSDCLTVSSPLCCAKLIIQTEQNSSSSSSSRAPWIILINPAWDSISYTSIAIEMSWACKLCNERRSPALSAFSLTHTLLLSLFLSFFDCLLPWNTSVAT